MPEVEPELVLVPVVVPVEDAPLELPLEELVALAELDEEPELADVEAVELLLVVVDVLEELLELLLDVVAPDELLLDVVAPDELLFAPVLLLEADAVLLVEPVDEVELASVPEPVVDALWVPLVAAVAPVVELLLVLVLFPQPMAAMTTKASAMRDMLSPRLCRHDIAVARRCSASDRGAVCCPAGSATRWRAWFKWARRTA